jgi:hypothetical protein
MRATEFLKEGLGSIVGDLLKDPFGGTALPTIPSPPKKPTMAIPKKTAIASPKKTAQADPSSVPLNKKDKYVSKEAVKSYLSSKMDNFKVAGIMANIQAESGFRPGVMGDHGTSGGLFQHHAERFTKMVAASGGPQGWKTNWKGQIDFALTEPAGRKYLRMKFNSPEEASKWWTLYFEIPANKQQVAVSRSLSASRFA